MRGPQKKSPGPRKAGSGPLSASDRWQRLSLRQSAFEAKGGNPRNGPFFRYAARENLDLLRARFEAGDQFALMLAIRKCANHDLVMPAWVAEAYITAFDMVLNYQAGSWDAVFGVPMPKGKSLAALRKRRMLKFAVLNAVNDAKSSGHVVDDNLFVEIGKELGIGRTLVKEYYQAARKELRTIPAAVYMLLDPFVLDKQPDSSDLPKAGKKR